MTDAWRLVRYRGRAPARRARAELRGARVRPASSGSRSASRSCGRGRGSTPRGALAQARERDGEARARAAARDPGRGQGRHRHRGPADGLRLADLRGPPAGARRGLRRVAARGRRGGARQDRHDGVRDLRAAADRQPPGSGAHARRLVERQRRGGRRRDGAARLRDPDGRVGDPARLVLRRRGLQAGARVALDGRDQAAQRAARHARAARPQRRRTRRCWAGSRCRRASGAWRSAARRGGTGSRTAAGPLWRRRPSRLGAEEVELPPEFAGLAEAQETVMAFDVARNLEPEWRDHRDELSGAMRDYIERGRTVTAEDAARRARRWGSGAASLLPDVFAGFDALMVPGALGEAPLRVDGPHGRSAAVPGVDVPGRAGAQRPGDGGAGGDADRRAAGGARRGRGAGAGAWVEGTLASPAGAG